MPYFFNLVAAAKKPFSSRQAAEKSVQKKTLNGTVHE